MCVQNWQKIIYIHFHRPCDCFLSHWLINLTHTTSSVLYQQSTNILANNIEISLTLSPRFASNTNTLPLCQRVSLTIGIAGHCKIQQHICSEKVLPIGQFHQPMCFFCYTFISSSLLMFPFFLENSTPFSHQRLCFASIIYIKTKMTHTRNELNYFYYSTFVKS